MSARFLKKSWWVDFRFAGKRYRQRSPINTEQAARKHEILMRERMLRGEPAYDGRTDVPIFSGFADEWLVTYVDTHNKPSVQRGYRSILGVHLVPFFGKKRLDEIKSFDIEKYQGAKLREGLSAKSINGHLAVLMKCLRTAADWERISAVPRAKPLKMVPPKFDFLTFEESDRLIAAAASEPHWHSMIVAALQTGLRLGELRALDWENVDLVNGHLTVCRSITDGIVSTPKNHKIRHVPLTEEARAVLAPMAKKRGGVWRGRGGCDHANKIVYAALGRITARAGLRHIGWHTLRHTFASQLSMSGVPIAVIRELLGHSDINMTMRYAHLSPSILKNAVAVLGRRRSATVQMGNPRSTGGDRLPDVPIAVPRPNPRILLN